LFWKKQSFPISVLSLLLSACASGTKDGFVAYRHPTLGYSFEYPMEKVDIFQEYKLGNSLHLGGSANIGFSVTEYSDDRDEEAEMRMGECKAVEIGGKLAFSHEGIGTGDFWFSENVVFCPSRMITIQYSNVDRDDAYEAVLKDIVDSFEC